MSDSLDPSTAQIDCCPRHPKIVGTYKSNGTLVCAPVLTAAALVKHLNIFNQLSENLPRELCNISKKKVTPWGLQSIQNTWRILAILEQHGPKAITSQIAAEGWELSMVFEPTMSAMCQRNKSQETRNIINHNTKLREWEGNYLLSGKGIYENIFFLLYYLIKRTSAR